MSQLKGKRDFLEVSSALFLTATAGVLNRERQGFGRGYVKSQKFTLKGEG